MRGTGGIIMIWGMLILCMLMLLGNSESSGIRGVEDKGGGYNYGEALSKGILYFEGQRSGKLPSTTQRVNWRDDSALSDGFPDHVYITIVSLTLIFLIEELMTQFITHLTQVVIRTHNNVRVCRLIN